MKPRGNTGLIFGGVGVGIVVVIALIAVVAGSGGEKKRTRKNKEKAAVVDVMPRASTPSSSELRTRKKEIQPIKKSTAKPSKPDSYYLKLLDEKLWKEAKGYANEANRMLRDMKEGIIPSGMDRKSVNIKARELLCMAADKGSEFMTPLDNRREEAERFIKLYEDIMMKWIRKSRQLLFDTKN